MDIDHFSLIIPVILIKKFYGTMICLNLPVKLCFTKSYTKKN